MVMEEKEKIEQPKETIEDSEISLSEIYNTIHRQIIGLASTVAFYNLQQTLQKPEEKCSAPDFNSLIFDIFI
jgi:hypothetical protein